ncbi:MAG TPA: hypothetical protein VJP08_03660, partial [Actinomycetota bacterium]|nr:hypothetical protein [Actinomycetota bacterium]
MSRIGKQPIAIPDGVTVELSGTTVSVSGPGDALQAADGPFPFGAVLHLEHDPSLGSLALQPVAGHVALPGQQLGHVFLEPGGGDLDLLLVRQIR